jgi:xanthine dehydrogenase/oxidase
MSSWDASGYSYLRVTDTDAPMAELILIPDIAEDMDHLASLKVGALVAVQVSGEAVYTDDIPLPSDCLHAALVTSTVPHARITGIEASEALSMPGVVGFWTAKDVPGDPNIGPVFPDETCFAEEVVTCVGQVIGVLAAASHQLACRAARAVKVQDCQRELVCA